MKQYPDWQTLLTTYIPGTTSTLQQAHQEMLENAVLPAVQAWSQRYHLEELREGHPQPASKRLYACAFSAVTRTLDPHDIHRASMLACFSWWVSVLDHYFDHDVVSFVGTQHWSLDQRIAYLQQQFTYISAPLAASGPLCMGLTHKQSGSLPHRFLPGNWKQHATILLRDALADLCRQLQCHLTIHVDEERRLFAWTTVLAELTRFMHGQYRDVSGTLYYHMLQQYPADLEVYLMQLRDGVGLRALAAISLACEIATINMHDWNSWLPALEVGSHIIRLVNDCGTFMREQAEEKPTSITIALAGLGYPIDVRYTLDSTAVVQAIQVVHKLLHRKRIRFHLLISQLLQEAPLTPFSYCIIKAVASIAQFYQAGGDYEVPDDKNATGEVPHID